MRLDKLLANTGYGSRKDVKKLIKSNKVKVNEVIMKDSGSHINLEKDIVYVGDQLVNYQEFYYLILNKAPGYISATEDKREQTVIDLLPQKYQNKGLFPVGRLDKDTEGLLLLTNDGKLGHKLTSPRHEIKKVYYVKVAGMLTPEDIEKFSFGLEIGDGYLTKPAELKILHKGEESEAEVTITEGKFHQVKRMFLAIGKKVIYLQRIKMGELTLDPNLKIGKIRELTSEELSYCLKLKETGDESGSAH